MTTNFNTSQFHNGVALPMLGKNIIMDEEAYSGPVGGVVPSHMQVVNTKPLFNGNGDASQNSAVPGEVVSVDNTPMSRQIMLISAGIAGVGLLAKKRAVTILGLVGVGIGIIMHYKAKKDIEVASFFNATGRSKNFPKYRVLRGTTGVGFNTSTNILLQTPPGYAIEDGAVIQSVPTPPAFASTYGIPDNTMVVFQYTPNIVGFISKSELKLIPPSKKGNLFNNAAGKKSNSLFSPKRGGWTPCDSYCAYCTSFGGYCTADGPAGCTCHLLGQDIEKKL